MFLNISGRAIVSPLVAGLALIQYDESKLHA